MIHIEKLSSKDLGRCTWQTFIDNFLGTKATRRQNFKLWEPHLPPFRGVYLNTEILTSYFLPKLSNVKLGMHYGIDGIDIDLLLLGEILVENLVIELSPDNITSLPKNKLKVLLEKYPVILNDFEEGGNLYGTYELNLVKFLSERNIKPKQLFLVGSGVQNSDYPDLNIHAISYDYWMIISATISEQFSNALFDSTYKQQLLDKIHYNSASDFCIIPVFKPRQHRLEMLAYLDSIGILEQCDWSLAYNYSPKINRFHSSTAQSSSSTAITEYFLTNHNFPKFLSNNTGLHWSDIISPNMADFAKYKYYLVIETFLGNELITPMGGCGFLTEKTFKSFLTASAPIMFGPAESTQRLKTLGFKTLTEHLDISDYRSVGNFLNELSLTPTYEKDLIQHNFDLITNNDFLADQIAAPLNKIAELINSIRR